MSPTHLSDPLTGASLVELSLHRLGERTCVINVGTELRHIELPLVEEAVEGVMRDEGMRDLVFDLTFLRRYETFALVRLAREWDRLAASGCMIHVAAREARVVADLERLTGTSGWQLHSSTTRALRALLSAPIE
jgi:anti-anti-sigma regulatory factor